MKIALATCQVLPEPDPDEMPLLNALREAGHDAESVAWDDPDADWGVFDACVIRATWNYHRQPDAFLAWVERVASQTLLLNPPEVVRWNIHKHYLRSLEDRRIPIVPTAWVNKGSARTIGDIVSEFPWDKVVIKPCVGAGSFGTRVFDLAQRDQRAAGESYLRQLSAAEDTMVQRYMSSVESGGETSLVTIAGELSHAIEKQARFDDQDESVRAKPELTDEEHRFASAVLEACGFETLYARVDIMRTDDGGIVLSELELIEPSLFFDHCPGSVDRMVRAIVGRVPV